MAFEFSEFSSLYGGSSGGGFCDDIFGSFRGGGKGSRKGAAIERNLPCSLEDLYKGTTKKMKISRDVMDSIGRPTTVEEILTIEIKPGWKKGTKITFPEKGNEQRGVIPSDLVFIIDEKPHSLFKRDSNDLIVIRKISLTEALTGYTAKFTTLDGRHLSVPINSVIGPNYEEVLKKEGMPVPKDPSIKGDLKIKFNIKFPSGLTSEQKTGIKRLLVLSDPQKRAVYDQYGEEGFNHRSADDIFSEFFGFSSSYGDSSGGGGGADPFSGRSADDNFSEFFGFSSPYGDSSGGGWGRGGMFGDDLFGSFRGGGEGSGGGGQPRKGAAIERNLPCSLEVLFKGTTKKMKISRDVMDSIGRPTSVEEILTIEIKPGWKKGTKITFPEKGNEQRGVIPSDLVFIIDEKPHTLFKRDSNDLIVTRKISLVEALTGYTAKITTLDGRHLTVPINSVIGPNYEEVLKEEGMPVPKDPSKKGDLKIKFNIKFPSRLTSEQKTGIKRLLVSPSAS